MSAVKLAEEWDGRISRIARNLTDFTDSDAARLVRLRAARYAGRTATEASRAIEALKAVNDDYLVLLGIVDEAVRESRRTGLFTNRDETVHRLLVGRSVRLRTLSVPISKRGLLDDAESQETASPSEILTAMQRAFVEARDVITAIVEAESALSGRVASAKARANTLTQWQSATGLSLSSGFPVGNVSDLENDPLDASDRLRTMETALSAAEAERDRLDLVLGTCRARLAQASEHLQGLQGLYREVQAASAALADFTLVPKADPGSEDRALSEWLAKLEAFLARGALRPVEVGLGKWETALTAARSRAEIALSALQTPVKQREDLRGLLRALRAKALAVGDPGEPERQAAKAALAQSPFDLSAASEAVRRYEAAVSAAASFGNRIR